MQCRPVLHRKCPSLNGAVVIKGEQTGKTEADSGVLDGGPGPRRIPAEVNLPGPLFALVTGAQKPRIGVAPVAQDHARRCSRFATSPRSCDVDAAFSLASRIWS